VGARWFVDETYVKVAGVWRYGVPGRGSARPGDRLYVSGADATFWRPAVLHRRAQRHGEPDEVVDRPGPGAQGTSSVSCYRPRSTTLRSTPNNRVECDHGRLKARLRPSATEDRPHRNPDHSRPCLRSEPASRALRTRVDAWHPLLQVRGGLRPNLPRPSDRRAGNTPTSLPPGPSTITPTQCAPKSYQVVLMPDRCFHLPVHVAAVRGSRRYPVTFGEHVRDRYLSTSSYARTPR